jgi:hypothetical protein
VDYLAISLSYLLRAAYLFLSASSSAFILAYSSSIFFLNFSCESSGTNLAFAISSLKLLILLYSGR